MDVFIIIGIALVLVFNFWSKQRKQQAEMQNQKKAKVRPRPIQHQGAEMGSGSMYIPRKNQGKAQIRNSKMRGCDVSEYKMELRNLKADSQPSSRREISLNTSSEVRRAFIYSEIFRRKYDN